MSNGLHNVTVYVNDAYGNNAKSETFNFTVAVAKKVLQTEPFPTATVAAVSAVLVAVVFGAWLVIYFKKHKR